MRYLILFLSVVFLLTACPRSQSPGEEKRYNLRGKIVEVDRAKKTAKIAHEEIPEMPMPAMTMDFPIRADWVWDDLTKDSEIRAELVVAKDEFWLENIGIVAAPNPNSPAPTPNLNFAQVGQEIPDFTLTNQDGKRFSMKDYRGRALAITFIYTRCPLPNFCILMSRHFSDLAVQLNNSDSDLKDKIRLLSISFDPKIDTPAKLKEYGTGYLGNPAKPDFTVWQLATGTDKEVRAIADFFGLQYETDANDNTQFTHSLRTAVIAPDGKVTKIFAGNEWTPNELLRELQATLK